MNTLRRPGARLSGRPRSCWTFHVMQRNGAAGPGALPVGGTHIATCVCDCHPHTCVRAHTLLDSRPGLPLGWAGLSCVPPLDILGPTGTGVGKQTVPLCEGEDTPSSTWTRARARVQGWRGAGSQPAPPPGRLPCATYTPHNCPATCSQPSASGESRVHVYVDSAWGRQGRLVCRRRGWRGPSAHWLTACVEQQC